MKKVLIVVVSLIVLLVIGFLLMPSSINYSETVVVKRPWQPFERNVVNMKQWKNWWPGKQLGDSLFEFQQKRFRVTNVLLNGFEAMEADDTLKRYAFHFTSQANMQTAITWAAVDNRIHGPVDKLRGYLNYSSFRSELRSWLSAVQYFFESDQQLYGVSISKIKVPDLYMIALKAQYRQVPTTEEIYGLVDEIKAYIKSQNGKERNVPNMHLYAESPDSYQLMVAIPTETRLAGNDRFLLKEMIPGSLLVAEVQGGAYKALQAQDNMTWYMRDYNKSSPAIPYQALVTNRMQEPDSNKWVTKIYYPVFE